MKTVLELYPDYQAVDPELWKYQRGLIKYEKNDTGVTSITIDEDVIDLSRGIDPKLIKPYQPKVTLAPWSEVQQIYFDIETRGLDPFEKEIIAIGIIDSHCTIYPDKCHFLVHGQNVQNLQGSEYTFFEDEESLLRHFLDLLPRLKKKETAILGHYNGWVFDWPYIKTRCELWGIPFHNYAWVSPYPTIDATAQFFGKPITTTENRKAGKAGYNSFYVKGFEGVDVMHKVLSYDFIARKLTQGYSLKEVPYELGLKTEVRTELTFPQMLECYDTDNWELLLKYLKDDLLDTLAVGNYVLPPYYYQKQLMPWIRLQSIFTRGNGGKWNELITSEYVKIDYTDPKGAKATLIAAQEEFKRSFKSFKTGIKADTPKKFVGGLTGAIGGLFWNVGKIDVKSLYPSIMLKYGIYSYKDPDAKILSILKFCKDTRISIKENPTKTFEMCILEASLKVLINSAYGVLGTTGIIFNDIEAAALVTAYGRKILKTMVEALEYLGCINIEIDTDGIYFSSKQDHDFITREVQTKLPYGIEIDNELFGECIYIPPKDFSFNEKEGDKKYFPGLRKNYIIVTPSKLKVSGKFRKRDQPKFLKGFLPDCVKYISELCKSQGLEPNSEKYFEVLNDPNTLQNFIYTYKKRIDFWDEEKLKEQLMITRKARSNESKMYQLDGAVDDTGIAHYYLSYQPKFGKKGQLLKSNPFTPSTTVCESVLAAYRIKVDLMGMELLTVLSHHDKMRLKVVDGLLSVEV